MKKLPRKTKSNRTAAAAVPQISAAAQQTFQNAALPTSTGGYRTYPTYQTWGPKKLNEIWRQRDHVQISRFLQDKIPQLGYCIHSLPQEAIGKGIGLKSVSANLDFKIAATAHFKAWADSIAVDLRKESTFYKLQCRWLSAILGDGECFTHKIADQSESSRSWKLSDKRKRRLQIQTFLRDQLTNGTLKREDAISTRWMDGVKYNGLDQLELIRINQDTSGNVSSSTTFLDLPASNVHHLKAHLTFGQYHGVPWIFRSNEDLLDALDLKAIRKHSAKIRSALLGATSTRDGKMPNSMQAAQSAEKLGNPATDTGRRFMEIGEGAVMIPLADGETINFFQGGEALPFKDILEQIIHPFVFGLGYPVEWIFGMGNLGGTAFRGLTEKVKRAHENMRSLLHPFLQWVWEWVISDAMMPGGPLAKFSNVEDWNDIDFVSDPDPSVDLGRDHKADMENLRANAITMEDLIEKRTGGSGTAIRHARINEKLDDIRYALAQATGKPIESIAIPPSIACLVAIDPVQLQAMSGLASTISPETLATELAALAEG